MALYGYIAEAASANIAARYTEAIVNYCESLCTFPHRGTMRDDVRPGLRITNYKKRAVIAFEVDAEQAKCPNRTKNRANCRGSHVKFHDLKTSDLLRQFPVSYSDLP